MMDNPNVNVSPIPHGDSTQAKEPLSLDGAVDFWQAFWFWLKLGFISFGGPAGQIAIMHQELVQKRRWISEQRFLHALNFCMVLPGPEAQQLATYLGWLMHKTRGGLMAGLFFILPSFFLLIALSALYVSFGQVSWVQAALFGIKPAVTAIVIQAAYRIGGKTLKTPALGCIAVMAFLAVRLGDVAFPVIILSSALLGWILGRLQPHWIEIPTAHTGSTQSSSAALIGDQTPTPAHAIFTRRGLGRTALVGSLCWLIPMAWLYEQLGETHVLTQMAWFFTKAALLTFGGAYAVLPYVYHGAVSEFSWLNAAQMMDGLALGETTPGPLIMIVTYVGFMGGHIKAFWGEDHAMLSAFVAACCVTWFTFLPSFVFIFMGGPMIESARAQVRLGHTMSAITASIVGVIVNLGLFFALQVLWTNDWVPSQLSSWFTSLDWRASLILLLSLWALIKLKRSVIEVIVLAAVFGASLQRIF